MDKFEAQFEGLDVQSSYMENAMGTTTATATPQARKKIGPTEVEGDKLGE